MPSNFIDSEHLARTKAFDACIEAANNSVEHLSNQELLAEMSDMPGHLRAANEEAFLLNVRHGVASVPKKKLGGNGFGILPFLQSDSDVRGDKSILTPTPNRLKFMQNRSIGLTDVNTKTREALALNFGELALNVSPGSLATTSTKSSKAIREGETLFHFQSRPIISLSHKLKTPAETGSFMLHEYVHGLDQEENWHDQKVDEECLLSEQELRAYYIGAMGHIAGVVSLQENFRRQQADPDRPLEPTPKIINFYKGIGVIR